MEPLFIEFFGLPGSGKTTVVQELRDELIQKGFTVATSDVEFRNWLKSLPKITKFGLILRSSLSILPFIFRCLLFVKSLDRIESDRIKHLKKTPLRLIYLKYFLRKNTHQITLFDQFEIQKIWSLGAFSKTYDKKALEKVLQSLYHFYPVVPVFINSDIDTVLKRISKRPNNGSRFDNIDIDSANKLLCRSLILMNDIYNITFESQQKGVVLDAVDNIFSNKVKVLQLIVESKESE